MKLESYLQIRGLICPEAVCKSLSEDKKMPKTIDFSLEWDEKHRTQEMRGTAARVWATEGEGRKNDNGIAEEQ